MNSLKRALLVVDLQIDFCPGGSLGVSDGDLIIPKINALTEHFEALGAPVIFSRDWHPDNHHSFYSAGGPWPVHCVAGTLGASFHPSVSMPKQAWFVHKATQTDHEAYSAFDGTDLAQILRSEDVGEIVICGLATDYCVRATALDAMKEGFRAIVITDAVCGVDVTPGDSQEALNEMAKAGATLMKTSTLLDA